MHEIPGRTIITSAVSLTIWVSTDISTPWFVSQTCTAQGISNGPELPGPGTWVIIFLLEEAAKCFLSLIAPCSEGEDKHTLVCSWTSVVEDSIDGLGNTPWDCSPGAGTLNKTSFWISLENHLGLQRPSSDISLCRRDETVPDCDIFSRDFYLLAHSSVIWEASCFGKEMIKWL